MFEFPPFCEPPDIIKRECLSYYEYYLGNKDEENRRHGGQNYWTGPKSIEWHEGHFARDAMHGPGEYRCRYRGKNGLFFTYEGPLYLNRLHGYGVMSYPDGKVYTGLFNNDVRYGPGVETFANVRANVGLWRGTKLARLAWRPALNVAPELQATVGGRAMVDPLRVVLRTTFKTIGKVNQAVEYLKQQGSDPVSATENWTRLYPKHCTDTASQLCHVEFFDYEYYGGKISSLKHLDEEDLDTESQNSQDSTETYYAWNNAPATIDMMKHCFKHESQRKHTSIDLVSVLSGPRTAFKSPAMHELDCRTLLMGCYLGSVPNTVYLINERDVDPNITDMLGNSAVMYATCGDQATLINFLVEAGADVDSPNDSCCTPLAVALIRFLCARRDVPASGVMQALVPPLGAPASPPEPLTVLDWNIIREMQTLEPTKNTLGKTPSKLNKINLKNKSLTSIKVPDGPESKKNVNTLKPIDENEPENDLYKDVNSEYIIKVTDLIDTVAQSVTYLFELNNMVQEVYDEQQKLSVPEKNPKLKAPNKIIKEPTKPSKEVIFQNIQKEEVSLTSIETFKAEMFNRMKLTILQLLDNGAKPNLVRCPHPALAMAVMAGCPEVVGHLVRHGADVNEVYPQHLSYTPLDMAVSQPLNETTLNMVQALLQAGARADGRLRYVRPTSQTDQTEPGPTLLHAMLVKKADTEAEEDIRRQIMHLLLEYNCDPLMRYNGRSALDEATKHLELLDIIIKSPKTDLNATIDDSNQTILVKMFWMPYFKSLDSAERSQTLTNLLLFGADPLIECECEGVKYKNLFVLAKKTLNELSNRTAGGSKSKITTPKGQKLEAKPSVTKGKKVEPKKGETLASEDIANLKQAIDLMTECSRILYIRWLQTQLVKEIIGIISRYKHRHWSMMIKEFHNKKAAGLWITAQRCLEIWGHLNTTRRKIYKDRTILWNLLCIAHFFHLRSVMSCGFNKVTTAERDEAEAYAHSILKDNKKSEIVPLQRYGQPELFVNADSKFDVCFECFLPLTEDRVLCQSCKFISYCNLACLKDSIEKSNGHACNDYLILKYFPSCESPATFGDDEPILKEPSVIKN